ncbi:MAG: hypothetical protein ACYTXA_17005 [Nostoc sp.]
MHHTSLREAAPTATLLRRRSVQVPNAPIKKKEGRACCCWLIPSADP